MRRRRRSGGVDERTVIRIERGQRCGQRERSPWPGGKRSLTLPRMTDRVRRPEVCSSFLPLPCGERKHGLTFACIFDEQKVSFHNKAVKFDWAKQAHQKPPKCQGLVPSRTTLKNRPADLNGFPPSA